jgi:hypothetical protein
MYYIEPKYSYININQYRHFIQDHKFTSLPTFHVPALLDVPSPCFKNPPFLLTYAFLTLLKYVISRGKSLAPLQALDFTV